jgi:GSH-dependent disulfide-bond oxidoreductase
MIELYCVFNTNAKAVTILLEECELGYNVFSPERAPENSDYWMPLLVDDLSPPMEGGGRVEISHTGAAMIYLAEKAAQFSSPQRYQAVQWVMWQTAHQMLRPPENQQEDLIVRTNHLFSMLDKRLDTNRGYVAGELYTFADMMCFPWIKNWLGQQEVIDDRYPRLRRWFGELSRREQVVHGLNPIDKMRFIPDRLIRTFEAHYLPGDPMTGYPPKIAR